MQCLVISGAQNAPTPVLMNLPKPFPGSGEVLIRVASAGVMPTELGWISTWFQKSGGVRVNTIPAHEFSGTVEALGSDVTGVKVGDEVFGMNDWYKDGAMAQYCIAPLGDVAPKPRTLTHSEAASVPISSLTAWQALFDHGRLQPGERVLTHGASGGVGNFAVQLAKQHGAYVIATASAANLDFVTQLGADQVIDYHAQTFEEVAGLVDLVLDTVGGDMLQRSWQVLGPGGRLVTVVSSVASSSDERAKRAFFIVEPRRDQLGRIASLLDTGRLKTFVNTAVPLSEAASAYARRVKGTGRGKTVVCIGKGADV
ncbi:MAG: NADP-dependent oxidoreductase [Acidobacteriaceae bacterium]|nr:NADP-dependent oxidoreductase [Acidobacteriaceae bacterium]